MNVSSGQANPSAEFIITHYMNQSTPFPKDKLPNAPQKSVDTPFCTSTHPPITIPLTQASA